MSKKRGYDYAQMLKCPHARWSKKGAERCLDCGVVRACAPFSDPGAFSDQLRQSYGMAMEGYGCTDDVEFLTLGTATDDPTFGAGLAFPAGQARRKATKKAGRR